MPIRGIHRARKERSMSSRAETPDLETVSAGGKVSFTRMIDLSVAIIPDAPHEPWKPKIHYLTHEGEGLEWVKRTFGAGEQDLPWSHGKGAAFEEVTAITHTGTHVDAPWHYGPES